MRDLPRLRLLVLAAAMATVASACGTVTHGGLPAQTSSHAASGTAASSATPSPTVPNPFTITARYSAASLGLDNPANLAVAPDGNLYVTDASQRVTVISPMGKVLRRWGRPGKGPGEFDFIMTDGPAAGRPVTAGIVIGPDGMVYVGDSGNGRVEVFSASGNYIRQLGSYGFGKAHFLFPGALAVGSNGDVYVGDDQQETVAKFSSAGAFEWQVGGPSASDADLVGHWHLASVDRHGTLIASNDDQGRVVYIDRNGHKVDAFGQDSQNGASGTFREGACDVTVDAAGHIFVNSCQEPLLSPHYTEVFDRTHHLVGAWFPSGFGWAPRFGPNGEVFTLADDGTLLELKVALPNA